ncbi:MAG: phage late control D family protein [Massilia sp.]
MKIEHERALWTASVGQQNRLLKLDTPLGPDLLIPQRVIGRDRLGRGFNFTIDAIAMRDDVVLKKLIAKQVTLWLRQSDSTYLPVHGFVHTVKRLGSEGRFTFCQLSISAWSHFLKFRSDSCIWQEKRVDDILIDVFNHHPQARGNYRFDLTQVAVVRSYCTQYETDWNFGNYSA